MMKPSPSVSDMTICYQVPCSSHMLQTYNSGKGRGVEDDREASGKPPRLMSCCIIVANGLAGFIQASWSVAGRAAQASPIICTPTVPMKIVGNTTIQGAANIAQAPYFTPCKVLAEYMR